MMKITEGLLVLVLLLNTSCAELRANFKDYAEPLEGETAKIRFNAYGTMFLIPEQNCLNWGGTGAGMVATMDPGRSSIHNKKSLGMMGRPIYRDGWSEVPVRAEKPAAVVYKYENLMIGYSKTTCEVAVTFLPKAGEQYSAHGTIGYGNCSIRIESLSSPSQQVPVYKAGSC